MKSCYIGKQVAQSMRKRNGRSIGTIALQFAKGNRLKWLDRQIEMLLEQV